MTELILIKTSNGKEVKKMLDKEHIAYEIFQEPKQDWESQEKKSLQEWQSLSDEELIMEWEKLSDNENGSTNNWK